MANSTGWDDVSGTAKKKTGGAYKEYPRLNYARVEYDTPYEFRPLDKPVGFLLYMMQHRDGSWRRAICDNPETCPIATKHNKEPVQKYAMAVINRANRQVELLEFTEGVYNKFKESKKLSGMEPGSSKDGGDFILTKTKKRMKNGEERTSYDLEFVKRTPITAEESKDMIAPLVDFFKDGRLSFIYKATPVEKIENVLFGEREAKAQTQTQQKATTAPAAKEKEVETTGDNIPF